MTQSSIWDEVVERCAAAGLAVTITERPTFEGDEAPWLRIEFPNGRASRNIAFSPRMIPDLTGTRFEFHRFLGDYEATIRTDIDVIEARIASFGALRRIWRLPGVEITPNTSGREWQDPESWKLVVEQEPNMHLEISAITPDLAVLVRSGSRSASLKLHGFGVTTHDEAVQVLESVGNSFFVDIDLRYDMPMQLALRRRPLRRHTMATVTDPPSFPVNRYAPEPTALYMYGRSAAGMPLLEFLAYYQTLEFFFPLFTRNEAVRRLRTSLRDPRFAMDDDVAIGRVLASIGAAGSGISEKEQCRAAVRASIDISHLEDLVMASEDHFCGSQSVAGVPRLQPQDRQRDLRDQVADRVYAIRCRIVHTKQDGGESGVELLLPSSAETRGLGPDVELMRSLAQQALIAGASALRL